MTIDSIRGEYRRYRALAESALAQLDDADLTRAPGPNANSIAVVAWHLAGNLRSRFTDCLTADGEKPWRAREEEFARREVSRADLLEQWSRGWEALFDAIDPLTDQDLERTVTIRGQPWSVVEALHRSLAHAAYHVGQIVYQAKTLRGERWSYLSIPPGGSDAYNQAPSFDRPDQQRERLGPSTA
ncbi:MAG: DUF1572 family protein [Planctomycetota bacterium]